MESQADEADTSDRETAVTGVRVADMTEAAAEETDVEAEAEAEVEAAEVGGEVGEANEADEAEDEEDEVAVEPHDTAATTVMLVATS